MDVHKSKSCDCSGNNWIDASTPSVGIVRNDSLNQISQILWPRADMVWKRLLGLAVMCSNEAAFSPQSELNKPGVANDNLL